GVFGGSGLEGFTGSGSGGFGQVGGAVSGGGGGTGAAQAGGYLGRLQDWQEIRNQQANVSFIRSSLRDLEERVEEVGPLQVEQTRQALANAQSVLLTSLAGYHDGVDGYKIALGLPPDLPITMDESLLKPLQLVDPQLSALRDAVDTLRQEVGDQFPNYDRAALLRMARAAAALRPRVIANLDIVRDDLIALDHAAPERRESLDNVRSHPDFADMTLDRAVFSAKAFDALVKKNKDEFVKLSAELSSLADQLAARIDQAPNLSDEELHSHLVGGLRETSESLVMLTLVQARARVETVTLSPIAVTDRQALAIAREYRRDWSNARAQLVDVWRLIEFNGADLESDLDIVVSGEIRSLGNDLMGFRGENGRLRLALQFDAPITRLAERNNYRQSLISYQGARR
ncbi:MAG: hypothetical protein N2C14_21410, partial [Planctomycetales bacterium]